MEKILEVFNLEDNILNQKIFKKYFYESEDLQKSQKNIIKSNVDEVNLISMVKNKNLNIPEYEDQQVQYLEIAIVEVTLNRSDKKMEIAEILNKLIQYPMVLFLKYKDQVDLSLCEKRKNQQTGENNVIEDIIVVENINSYSSYEDYLISIMYLDKTNIYNYYRDLYSKTYALELSRSIDKFEEISSMDLELLKTGFMDLKHLDRDIEVLKNKIKEEHDIGRRVDYNLEMKKLEKKREKLFDRLEDL